MIRDWSLTDRAADSLAEEYHHATNLNTWRARQLSERIQMFTGSEEVQRVVSNAEKWYPGSEVVALPSVAGAPSTAFWEAALTRRTPRSLGSGSVPISSLGRILAMSVGVTGSPDEMHEVRAYPSAGALYPLEIYILARAVSGLSPGTYHYSPSRHSLELVADRPSDDQIDEAVFLGGSGSRAALLVLISAVFFRNLSKYGDRGYRMILLEAGHVGQGVCLASTVEGLGSIPCGGFMDAELNQWIQVDGLEESVMYPIAVGRLEE